jgi:glycosyltransferase involved in cell wall biosynthesis
MTYKYIYIKNGDVVTQLERIASLWPTPITSGPDAFIYDFISQNQESEILLLSRAQRKAEFEYRKVKAFVFPEKVSIFGKAPARIVYFLSVVALALRYRPDRILCGSNGGALWASYLISKLLSIPLVHSRHNRVTYEGGPWYRRIGLAIDGFIIRRADGVICHGPYLKDELEKLGVAADRLIEFDVGFSDMKQTDQLHYADAPCSDEVNYLLYMGRIERNKGVFDLLTAAKDIHSKTDKSFKLVYAGDGRHSKELKDAVTRLGMDRYVNILGRVPHDKLGPIISQSLAVVTPTHSDFPEGRCMAAMEAHVMGVPVIAPAFGPFPYLVEHGVNGLMYTPGSVDELGSCIRRLLDNCDERRRLSEGAEIAGRKLLEPVRTFSVAVNQVFATA